MRTYLVAYSDEEIEKLIGKLTLFQKKIFDSKFRESGDRRYSLMFAKSYPDDYEVDK